MKWRKLITSVLIVLFLAGTSLTMGCSAKQDAWKEVEKAKIEALKAIGQARAGQDRKSKIEIRAADPSKPVIFTNAIIKGEFYHPETGQQTNPLLRPNQQPKSWDEQAFKYVALALGFWKDMNAWNAIENVAVAGIQHAGNVTTTTNTTDIRDSYKTSGDLSPQVVGDHNDTRVTGPRDTTTSETYQDPE